MAYPNKPAETQYSINDLIQNRWSPRTFDHNKAITKEDIQQLLEAGRWAPSSNNLQPWRIIWGLKGSESYQQIYNILVPFNQTWAINASALMACAFKKDLPDGQDNFHALHDLGAFSAFMTIQAQSMGIAVHQMAGIDYNKARSDLGFPENYHVATAIAIGYYGGEPEEDLPQDLLQAETSPNRTRNKQDQFAFNGSFKDVISS